MHDNADTTLMTKMLLPRRRDDILTRPRLLNLLYDMVDYKLVLLSAPAGYGKSTLLVDFAHDLEHPVCWYALDASDHDPRVFVERLVHSLRRRFPGFGEQTLRALAAASDFRNGMPGLVRVLVNEIVANIAQWFVLVLDDYHALGGSPAIDAFISNFVAAQRNQCLTIVASRSVPDLPLIISLVARGGVGGIGQEEMRFLPGEIQELFAHNYDVALSDDEAAELAEQSEGWITGLLLTAYARWQGVLQTWMRARNSRRPIYSYLAQEVFDQQPPEIQRFLLVSSTLGEMSPALCEEVLGVADAERLLETVEAQNLFVSRLEGESEWYRYHHLFRDFLQARMKAQDPDAWSALHVQAAAWFEARGETRAAIDHDLAVANTAAAAERMAMVARDLYVAGQLTTLMTWRELLPDALLVEVPRLALHQSRAAFKLGDYAAALHLTEIAERGYRAADDALGAAYAQAQRCEVWLVQGRTAEALALSRQVLTLAETAGLPIDAEAHRLLGRAYADQGRLAAAREHFEAALKLGETQADAYGSALVRTGLAMVAGLQGRLEEAVALHREAVQIWRRLGSDTALTDELNDMGYHLYTLGEYDEALACFRESLALSQQTGLRRAQAYALVNLCEMTRDLGVLDVAMEYGEAGHEMAQRIGDRFLASYSLEAQALTLRATGDREGAYFAVDAALRQAELHPTEYEQGRYRASLGLLKAERGSVGEGLVDLDAAVARLATAGAPMELYRARFLRAWARCLADREAEAVADLGELLDAMETRGHLRVLTTEGQHMRPLLEAGLAAYKGARKGSAALRRGQSLRKVLQEVDALAETAARLFPQRAPASAVSGPPLRIFGFGTGQVEVGTEVVPAPAWGSVTARHLLFYMLTYRERTRDQILADFWPDLTPQKAKASFHTTKFRLHQAVGRDVIDFDGRVYSLHPEFDAWFDVTAFRQGVRAWRETQSVDALADAVKLYTGDFLTDCYMDWCVAERESLRVQCLEALETLADRLLARRQYRRAIQALRQALALEPARETFHRQLMRAYALSGQRSRALAQYGQCEQALRAELGALPSQRTTELYERILAEAALD